LFDAVEQQLGLKLEKQNVPMPVIVVDRVNEKPTGNPPGVSAKLPPSATEFEVASLKLSAPGEEPGGGGFLNGGRVDLKGFPLRGLITLAWDIHPGMDIVGEPKWLNSAAVDLVAKVSSTVVPADTRLTMSDIQPMLRELLEDRFRIRTHYEDRPLNTYVLTAVKPKLQKADPASRTRCKTSPAPVQPGSTNTGPPLIQAVCQNITMAQFADELLNMAPSYLHYQPPDETGLAGSWDFTFTFSRSMPGGAGAGRGGRNSGDAAPSASTDAAPDPSGASSLFDGLTHQLGLKLDMQKRPVPVLVLDHIEEKPVGN
jgi:uncharacterized protein (TIGR03435 family)